MKFFPGACFGWDARIFLREMDIKPRFGGTIGSWDAHLEFLLCHFKVFRLHAKQHYAAEAERVRSGKDPGYCNMIARGPVSCVLGDVTGQIFRSQVTSFWLPFSNLSTFEAVCLALY